MARNFDNWIKAYVQHTRYSESPDNFHFWTAVSTVAGALRRRVWIDQRIFQWTPNFYIILVGPPGVAAKSTSIRQGLNILEKIPGINFGPQSMTWQALAVALEKSTEGVEILEEMHVMSCLTIVISELGTFLNAKDDELLSTLIAMWDGQKELWKRDTKTQGSTEIRNPWLNVIGCTTPAWIRANIPNTMIGGGLTSRIIFVYGDKKRQLVAYPSQLVTSADYSNEEDRLQEDLQQIADLKGEYTFDNEALAWGEEWYEQLNKNRPSHMKSDRFDGYLARKQTHLHKLAIIFAAAKRNDLVLLKEDLEEADIAILDIENDMLKVFSSIGVTPGAQISQELLGTIKNAKAMEYTHLWRIASLTIPHKEFIEAIKGLLEAGYIKLEQKDSIKWITYLAPTLPSSVPK